VVGAGQYLLVETDAVYGNTSLTEAGDHVSFLTINRDKLDVPADRADDWVWVRPFCEPYESFSAEGEALTRKSLAEEQAEAAGRTIALNDEPPSQTSMANRNHTDAVQVDHRAS
jgi:RNA polymerase sigma-70 factor (ECF subfamily)